MEKSIFDITDSWLSDEGPQASVVVSCRARFARNLSGLPFPPHASKPALKKVVDLVKDAIHDSERFRHFHCLTIDGFAEKDRQHLRESQVISQEMERGGEYRLIFVGDNPITTVMINEEDHLRFFVILSGLQIQQTLNHLLVVDDELSARLRFAFSDRYGYLTACPTNTGTGLRASVMLHLPALCETKEVEAIMESIPSRGMAVRGLYGEHSAHIGSFYQVSNETTLGQSEQQIVDRLADWIQQLVDKELQARERLFRDSRERTEDRVYRALSLLACSRVMDTREAIELLSILRLGIDVGIVRDVTHSQLNRMIVRVQPGHLQREKGEALDPDRRDIVRASFLRDNFRRALPFVN